MQLLLTEIAQCTKGVLIGDDVAISAVSINTRTLEEGALYIAIKGQNFDGHDFVAQAEIAGARAVLVESKQAEIKCAQIVVQDTKLALAELSAQWKQQAQVKTIAITGSNGKTTVKEMTAAILAINAKVHFTQGNLNNEIGVPLTLLQLQCDHEYAVVEMGANHAGEIAFSSHYTHADIAVITNVGQAHIEGFGSIEGIAHAKAEIITGLGAKGIAVLNKEDTFYPLWLQYAGDRQVVTFGFDDSADVRAESIEVVCSDHCFSTTFILVTGIGRIQIHLKLAGQHNILNALSASACCLSAGIELIQIQSALNGFQAVQGRLQPLVGRHGGLVIDDTYNANPSSVKVALEVLIQTTEAEAWFILGALGEMGQDSHAIHTELGMLIKAMGVKRLFAIGEEARFSVEAFGQGAVFFSDQDSLIKALTGALQGSESLLVKGSRSQKMEQVVAALVTDFRT